MPLSQSAGTFISGRSSSKRPLGRAVIEACEPRMLLSIAPTYHLTFDDEFNSLVLATGPGTPGWIPTDYWNNHWLSGNGEKQYYANPATDGYNPFSVSNGILTITAKPTPVGVNAAGQPYVSGEISTSHGAPYPQDPQGTGFSQQYGYFEMRAKLPAGKGLWPAFWMMPANGGQAAEYDVVEVLGQTPSDIYESSHWSSYSGNAGYDFAGHVNSSTGFHTYGFQWDANKIEWYIDGQLAHTDVNHSNTPMYMIVNLAVGGNWPGNPDGTTPFPADMQVDYVRAYSNDTAVATATPQSGYAADFSTMPILLDSTPNVANVTVGATADSYVKDGAATTNYGSDPILAVKNSGSSNGLNRRSLLKFDLTSASSISSGKLRLHLDGGLGYESASISAYAVADTSWAEGSITWNNQPAAGTKLATTIVTNSDAGGWVEWDLTSYLRQEKSLGHTLVTIELKSDTVSTNLFSFDSRNATDSTVRPQLAIVQPIVDVSPSADTYVQSGTSAGTNFGTSAGLMAKETGVPSSNYNRRSLLKFDLSTVASIGAGLLRVHRRGYMGSETATIGVYAVADTTWGESTATWTNQPAAGTELATASVTNADAGGWIQWDITSYLQQQKAAGNNLVTLELRSDTVTNDAFAFDSRDIGGTAIRPQLRITTGAATLAASADTYARDGSYAANNFGGDSSLVVKNSGTAGSGNNRNAYLKFDLTGLTSISSAKLRLYLPGSTGTNSASIGIYSVADTTWGESALNWNTQPTSSGSPIATTTVTNAAGGAWVEWDITSYLQQELSLGHTQVTLALKSITVTTDLFAFNSREVSGLGPQLAIT